MDKDRLAFVEIFGSDTEGLELGAVTLLYPAGLEDVVELSTLKVNSEDTDTMKDELGLKVSGLEVIGKDLLAEALLAVITERMERRIPDEADPCVYVEHEVEALLMCCVLLTDG